MPNLSYSFLFILYLLYYWFESHKLSINTNKWIVLYLCDSLHSSHYTQMLMELQCYFKLLINNTHYDVLHITLNTFSQTEPQGILIKYFCSTVWRLDVLHIWISVPPQEGHTTWHWTYIVSRNVIQWEHHSFGVYSFIHTVHKHNTGQCAGISWMIYIYDKHHCWRKTSPNIDDISSAFSKPQSM